MDTIFQPLPFLLLFLSWNVYIQANVVVMKSDNTSVAVDSFLDREALFGPSVPDDGIKGYVYNVNPFNACRPVEPPPNNSSVWIALIARDNCSFVDKVRSVQQWFAAAIVYNRKDDNSVTPMSGDGEGINIPSVFVGYDDGILLSKNYCYNCTVFENSKGSFEILIESEDHGYPTIGPVIFILFAVVVGLCLITMIVFLVFKWCRDFRRKRRSRLSIKHLKKIPQKKFKKGDEYDVCAICLDDYEEGDKIRLLPCSHVYHTKCIDPWLTKNKRSCPICKRKVIPGDDPDSDSENSDSEGESPSERTPLLGAGASNSSGPMNRRSTFDNSGLPAPDAQTRVSRVNENTSHASTDDSDLSDSEYGATGGVRHVNLGKENPLLSLGKSPVEESANQNSRNEQSANHNIEEAVVIETRNDGNDNVGFENDGEAAADDEEFDVVDDDIVFSEPSKRDDKKSNGVI